MKVSMKQAIKELSLIETEITKLLDFEEREKKVVYLKGEKPEESSYDLAKITKSIDLLQDKKRKIKLALAYANATVKTTYKEMTISELLVYLAQLNQKFLRLQRLANNTKKVRITTRDGQIEYTECRFEPTECDKTSVKVSEEIIQVQIAIDKANIDTIIEI